MDDRHIAARERDHAPGHRRLQRELVGLERVLVDGVALRVENDHLRRAEQAHQELVVLHDDITQV